VNKNEKIIAKLQQKSFKLKKEVELSDTAYKQSLDKLEESRIKWEEETTNCYALFEGFEINRVAKMKEFFEIMFKIEDTVYFLAFCLQRCKPPSYSIYFRLISSKTRSNTML